ncbi:hypothetical protein [Falsiroseomonas sp.]|uniref:hypothetical protein n=1 Tax=Falsiroseomonas sp. TaxID=2870721 RepID=UPI003565D6BF
MLHRVNLNNVVVAILVVAALGALISGPGPKIGERQSFPPTPAAIAFQQAEEAAAARQTEAQRQAEIARQVSAQAEEETILPEGEGRAETFGYCTACHNTALIRRSRFSRDQWDGLMDWMTERHGMNPLEGEMRSLIVDYLASHFGAAQAPARGRNPFLN